MAGSMGLEGVARDVGGADCKTESMRKSLGHMRSRGYYRAAIDTSRCLVGPPSSQKESEV